MPCTPLTCPSPVDMLEEPLDTMSPRANGADDMAFRPEGACRCRVNIRRCIEYLDNRYANTVVLTFAQIEDLLGFTLPDAARVDQAWWANTGPNDTPPPQSRSWTLASRTATPNLQAQTVMFERAQQ